MSEAEAAEATGNAADQADEGAAAATRKGGIVVLLVIVVSLVWYLLADRYAPYTSQARVQGYVVGVAPKVSGVVTDVYVQNNQEVQADEPLFQIDTSQYEIALEKARSDLENAHRQVDAGTATVDSARAALRSAQANELKARQDLDRLTRLREQDAGTISMRRLEQSQASLDSAVARVAKAQSDIQAAIEKKGGEDDSDNAILKSAQAAVEKAELDLGNTLVRASAAGRITDLQTDVGLYAGTGGPVLTLISVSDVWINADFTENNLGHMTEGGEVAILFDAIPGAVFSGTVRTIGLGVSAGSEHPPGKLPTVQNSRDWLRQAQRFPVLIDIDRDQFDELEGQLRIGGQVSVVSYSEGSGFLNMLGSFYIWLMSWFAYAY